MELIDVRNIILSIGWSICSIFMLSTILYLYVSKRKDSKYNNMTYNFMIAIISIVVILEILSSYTISRYNDMPILNEIVCKSYLFFVILGTFTIFEHLLYYDKNIPKKIFRILEVIIGLVGLMSCILLPVSFTYSIPYSVYGIIYKYIYIYIIIAGVVLTLLIGLKVIKFKNISGIPYVVACFYLIILYFYQTSTGDYMNIFSAFLTFICVYQFYNTESQEYALLDEYEKIKIELDAKNKERDEFIANLSKEIRTPMSNIVGFSNLIMLNKDNMQIQNVKNDGKEIHKEALNLLNIINNILDLSRFEAGKEELNEVDYSQEELILDLNNDLLNNYKDVKITYKFMDNYPRDLYGDKLKVEKLIELVCEYIFKDRIGRSLLLNFEYVAIGNQNIKEIITFNLSNVGIDVTLRQKKLELEKQIIDSYNKLLNSKIKYIQDSDNNIICSLEIVQKVISDRKLENIVEKIAQSSFKEDKISIDYSDKKILIVDDSQMNINIAKRLLKKYNINIEEAISGQECIKKVQQNNYDIIFLDDMMPGLSGIQTLGELQKLELKLPKVIALTANFYDGLKDEYVKNGFSDYLAKPIDPNKLDKLLKNLLYNKGGENE